MRIDPLLFPCTKLNSKWIKDFHSNPDTLKLIEKKMGKTLEDIGSGVGESYGTEHQELSIIFYLYLYADQCI